jgi:hypothetical protein
MASVFAPVFFPRLLDKKIDGSVVTADSYITEHS